MKRVFVSYRRSDGNAQLYVQLIRKSLENQFGNDGVFVDVADGNLPPGSDFETEIKQVFQNVDVLLVIIGKKWLDSRDTNTLTERRIDNPKDLVHIEVKTGLLNQDTLVIPLLVDNMTINDMPKKDQLPKEIETLARRNALEVSPGINFDNSISLLIDSIKKHRVKISKKYWRIRNLLRFTSVLGFSLTALGFITLMLLYTNYTKGVPVQTVSSSSTINISTTASESLKTNVPIEIVTLHIPQISTPIHTFSPSISPTTTETSTPEIIKSITPFIVATPTIIPTPQLLVSPSPMPGYFGGLLITANNQWIAPPPQIIDGTEMVLVPAGCFEMGPDANGVSGSQQCFTEPFWIDRFEVTNEAFSSVLTQRESDWDLPDHPRERITWYEADKYCRNIRGGRLLTEAEWEYAVRGPDGLIYPWENDSNWATRHDYENRTVYQTNSNFTTSPVGSKPDGQSWVGAFDLIGNVSEWTYTIFKPYPYISTDGRDLFNPLDNPRLLYGIDHVVVRGGSYNSRLDDLKATNRAPIDPTYGEANSIGLRCYLPFSG